MEQQRKRMGRPFVNEEKKHNHAYQFLFDKETIDEMRLLRNQGLNFQPFVRAFVKKLIEQQKENKFYELAE